MPHLLHRRSVLGLGLAAATTAGVGACAVKRPAQTSGRIRATWWGTDNQNAALNKVLDSFAKSAGVEITREALPWDGYWDKLATQTAAHNAPDLIMQAGSQIPGYASKDALQDLKKVSTLDPSVVDEGLQTFGAVGDQLFGVVAAANAMGLVVNPDLAEKASLSIPEGPWTWDALVDLANRAHTKLGDGVWGLDDAGGDLISFILYLRMTGQELYADDGSLTDVEAAATEWFTLWDELRKSGGAPPADVTAEGTSGPDGALTKKKLVMSLAWTQNFTSLSALSDIAWTIHLPPYSADHPSLWMNAASLWSISAGSANVDATGKLINYLLTDEDAVKTIGLTLGTPPTKKSRELLSSGLSGADERVTTFMDLVSEHSAPLNRLWPDGFVELRTKTTEINQAVGFGKMSIKDAVTKFLSVGHQQS